ncbi:MAG: hypothetical protein PHU44_11670 [Syntrophales bacterium]|nr:hypothetical protein [Syntrophales bacterium]MDD5641679.1 hypothetical protein [Syntrophales bacterium]
MIGKTILYNDILAEQIALQNPELTVGEIEDILEAIAELEAGRIEELDLNHWILTTDY